MMKAGWKEVHVGVEGDHVRINGVPVWKLEWRRTDDQPVQLPHPAHRSELHPFWIYEAAQGSKTVRFAATELSPSVWGFYVPE